MSPPLEYISQTNNHLSPTLEATNTNAASLEIFGVYNLTLGQGEEDLGSPVHIPGVLIEWWLMDLGLLNTPIQSTVTCYMYPIVCKGDKSPDLYWQQGEPEEQPISLVYRNTTSPDGPLNKRVQWTPVLLYPHKYRGSYAPTVPWGSYPTPNLIEYDPNNSMQDALANASKILEKLQPPFYSNYTIVPASMTVNSSQLLYAAYAPHTPLLSSEGAKKPLYVQGVYSRIAASLVGKSDQFSFANICDALTWISDSLRNGIIGVSPERKELITFFEEIDKILKNN